MPRYLAILFFVLFYWHVNSPRLRSALMKTTDCKHGTKITGQCAFCGEYPYDNEYCDMHQPLEFTPEELQLMDDDRGERECYMIEASREDNSNPPEYLEWARFTDGYWSTDRNAKSVRAWLTRLESGKLKDTTKRCATRITEPIIQSKHFTKQTNTREQQIPNDWRSFQ